MYSALAGFIEAGESAEEAIRREIIEEVGILVSDVHYFGSQSWPFPGQLMLGYIAYAKSNKLTINNQEISDANWFKYDQLPAGIPPSTIMSGKLIRYAVSKMAGKNES
jgi:NAD+ diphosphatase